jgi:hypothetical protein
MKNLIQNLITAVLVISAFVSFSQGGEDRDGEYLVPETTAAKLSWISPAEGFIPGTGFTGYFHAMTQTSIVLTNIKDANYINMKRGMDDAFFRENNLVKLGEFEVECNNGMKGYGYIASFELDGKRMIRHMVFVGNLNQTLWLNTTVREEYYEMVSKEIFEMYKTSDFSRN